MSPHQSSPEQAMRPPSNQADASTAQRTSPLKTLAWPELALPPINLYSAPRLTGTLAKA